MRAQSNHCSGTGETPPQTLESVQGLSLQDTEVPEHVRRGATELVKGLDHSSDEEQLTELGGAQLGKKVVRGDLIALYTALTRGWIRCGLDFMILTVFSNVSGSFLTPAL